MRISDWSSDVCSSDLDLRLDRLDHAFQGLHAQGVVVQRVGLRHAPDAKSGHVHAARSPSATPPGESPLARRPGRGGSFRSISCTSGDISGSLMGWKPCCRPQNSMRRSEEHTSELQSLMRSSYAVLCL